MKSCTTCHAPKTTVTCGACSEPLCKNCTQDLPEGSFCFQPHTPEYLTHRNYCSVCFAEKVSPALESYSEILERAKQMYVFFTTQKKLIPLLSKSNEVLRIEDCPDRDEAILRLAFLSAKRSFNAVVKVEVTAERIGVRKYKNCHWRAIGYPAHINVGKMERQDLLDQAFPG